MTTRFLAVPGTRDGVRALIHAPPRPLVLISRNGLGDNLFCSPRFELLKARFGELFFCSCVNAYTTIFHVSTIVRPIYAGGINGSERPLMSAAAFIENFERLGLDLGGPGSLRLHFGLFEPHLPHTDERAFVKGRRNFIELFDDGPTATQPPRDQVAPDLASKFFVDRVLDR